MSATGSAEERKLEFRDVHPEEKAMLCNTRDLTVTAEQLSNLQVRQNDQGDVWCLNSPDGNLSRSRQTSRVKLSYRTRGECFQLLQC